MSAPLRRSSSFAGALLLLYVVMLLVHLWLVGSKAPLTWELGSFLFSGLLLIGGACTAFTRGGFVVRSLAVVCGMLCGLNIVGAAITVVGGAIERREGAHDAIEEGHALSQSLATEMDAKDRPAAVNRQLQRQAAAAERLKSSDNPYTVVMGQAMAMEQELTHAPTLRLTKVGVDLMSKRFTDVPAMITRGDCSWNIAVSREYAEAVKEMQVACSLIPTELRQFLATTELPPHDAEEYLRGVTDGVARTKEMFDCHARMAEAHKAYFRFVKAHLEELTVTDKGVVIHDRETLAAYNELFDRRISAGRELKAMIEAEKQRIVQR